MVEKGVLEGAIGAVVGVTPPKIAPPLKGAQSSTNAMSAAEKGTTAETTEKVEVRRVMERVPAKGGRRGTKVEAKAHRTPATTAEEITGGVSVPKEETKEVERVNVEAMD